ncbi:PDZ domain-containing protein [Tundrisphaera lichenicola]|uniref:PDZ domain-containing protein n=1 Tax=Tundrisphaera lichenicola TaxID=2029860 RepID=UPI003EC0A5B9
MIRFSKVSRLAMIAGLAWPVLGQAQEIRPSEVTERIEETVDVTVDASDVAETSVITDELIGGDDKPGSETQTIRRIVRAQPSSENINIYSRTFFETLEAKYGLVLAPIDDALRTQLAIPKGEGVVVVEVKSMSLAEQAGLKSKDILLSLGDKPFVSVPQAQGLFLLLEKDPVRIKLIREGKPQQMSIVGPEHGFSAESAEFWIGVPVSPVDPILRSHLGELPAEAGLIANDVVKDSPADRAGVKKNDILISLGGQTLKSAENLIAQVQASEGKAVPLVVLRAGKPTTVEVTPTKRAHPTIVNFRGVPTNLRYQLFQPNVAIEIDPKSFRAENLTKADGNIELKDIRTNRIFRATPDQKQYEVKVFDQLQFNGKSSGEAAGKTMTSQGPIDIQLELLTNKAKANVDEATGRIEVQLKELSAKVEEIRKAIEALKTPSEH